MGVVKGGRPGMILLFFLLTAIPASTGQYFESENDTSNCSKGLVFDDMLVSSRRALTSMALSGETADLVYPETSKKHLLSLSSLSPRSLGPAHSGHAIPCNVLPPLYSPSLFSIV